MRDFYETDDDRLELGVSEEEQVEEQDFVLEDEIRPMIDRWSEWVDFIDR